MKSWETIYSNRNYPIKIQQIINEGNILHRVVIGKGNPAGAIVIICDDKQRILLTQQYRISVDSILWELPRGGSEPEESIIETARRELLEETGIGCKNGRFLGWIYPDSGILSSVIGVVFFNKNDVVSFGNVTDGEVDKIEWFSMSDLRKMINNGTLRDSMTLSALMIYENTRF